MKTSESEEQQALFEWAAVMGGRYPQLHMLFHIPNGGRRDAATAGKLKAEGVKAGVPDICLPCAVMPYHGLFIEMKVGNNKATAVQQEWLHKLSAEGYKVAVCYGWQDAAAVIMKYLRGD